MHRRFDGLAALLQTKLEADQFLGQTFAFLGLLGNPGKLLRQDATGYTCFARAWNKAADGYAVVDAIGRH
ncbi:IS66 family insertion sequence element accessory protein TnpB [Pseudomonas chlororaphis]|uniref:IS66 family insertion sequence element accessory protein TnpB n=1 Tax=Pseudomonas chlororaphis TaxID=587753 RepID=UPI0015DE3C03|nr:IS66 family insertion sequence element accessory protein TnpB [Pseudomonas chlororaphis subsp. aurantiaca]